MIKAKRHHANVCDFEKKCIKKHCFRAIMLKLKFVLVFKPRKTRVFCKSIKK